MTALEDDRSVQALCLVRSLRGRKEAHEEPLKLHTCVLCHSRCCPPQSGKDLSSPIVFRRPYSKVTPPTTGQNMSLILCTCVEDEPDPRHVFVDMITSEPL